MSSSFNHFCLSRHESHCSIPRVPVQRLTLSPSFSTFLLPNRPRRRLPKACKIREVPWTLKSVITSDTAQRVGFRRILLVLMYHGSSVGSTSPSRMPRSSSHSRRRASAHSWEHTIVSPDLRSFRHPETRHRIRRPLGVFNGHPAVFGLGGLPTGLGGVMTRLASPSSITGVPFFLRTFETSPHILWGFLFFIETLIIFEISYVR